MNSNGRLAVFCLSLLSPLYLLIGRQAFALVLLHLGAIFCFFRLKLLATEVFNSTSGFTFLALFSYYFWNMHGYRPQIAAAQVSNAFLGVSGFSHILGGLLLLLNGGAPFIIVALTTPFLCDLEKKNGSFDFKLIKKKRSYEKFIVKRAFLTSRYLYLILSLMCILTMTCINSALERRALLLIEDFSPKFFFELLICVFSVFVNTLVFIFRYRSV